MLKGLTGNIDRLVLGGVLLMAALHGHAAPTTSQSFDLQPGWNSIFVELDPDDNNPATLDDNAPARVFNLSDIQMVWAFPRSGSTVQYIEQPSEAGFSNPDWRVYIPSSVPTAALTNLHAVSAGRVYLVKLGGTQPKTLVVQGKPEFRRIQWLPESFNLVGFHANPDPTQQVTFADFLALPGSSNPAIYKLVNNNWTLQSKNSLVEPGRGYWIYNDGTIKLSGPLDIADNALNGLGFSELSTVTSLQLTNRSLLSLPAVQLTASDFPLRYFAGYTSPPERTPQWLPMTATSTAIASGRDASFLLAVDRTGMTDPAQGILAIRGGGMRIQLPLQADPIVAGTDGLWVGSVTLNAVSNVNAADPTLPELAPAELTFKLILHSGDAGVHLLKQVYLLGDFADQDQPRTVLITDDSALPAFTPLALARGENVGHRISSSAFDFSANKLLLSNRLDAPGDGLSGTIALTPDLPTHPMRHRRHPDHDNLRDDNFEPLPAQVASTFSEEVWTISRTIRLLPDQNLAPSPVAGLGTLTGVYEETLQGMHKRDIHMRGRFTLQRVSLIDELDPAPN
jgi:hypothetical protein